MFVQEHREFSKDKKKGCFIVSSSKQGLFDDLEEYSNLHKDKYIYYYLYPNPRPSNITYRPEYMMEVLLKDCIEEFCIVPFKLYREKMKQI